LKTPKKRMPNLKKLRQNANALIVVEKWHKAILRRIPTKLIPQDSFEKDYQGHQVHILGLNLQKKLWTITPHPTLVLNQSPLDLWIAKNCAEEVRETYGISSTTWQKIKVGVFVGLIIGIIIVTFMIVTASTGGTVA
jgi:hypothetical protein